MVGPNMCRGIDGSGEFGFFFQQRRDFLPKIGQQFVGARTFDLHESRIERVAADGNLLMRLEIDGNPILMVFEINGEGRIRSFLPYDRDGFGRPADDRIYVFAVESFEYGIDILRFQIGELYIYLISRIFGTCREQIGDTPDE